MMINFIILYLGILIQKRLLFQKFLINQENVEEFLQTKFDNFGGKILRPLFSILLLFSLEAVINDRWRVMPKTANIKQVGWIVL